MSPTRRRAASPCPDHMRTFADELDRRLDDEVAAVEVSVIVEVRDRRVIDHQFEVDRLAVDASDDDERIGDRGAGARYSNGYDSVRSLRENQRAIRNRLEGAG